MSQQVIDLQIGGMTCASCAADESATTSATGSGASSTNYSRPPDPPSPLSAKRNALTAHPLPGWTTLCRCVITARSLVLLELGGAWIVG